MLTVRRARTAVSGWQWAKRFKWPLKPLVAWVSCTTTTEFIVISRVWTCWYVEEKLKLREKMALWTDRCFRSMIISPLKSLISVKVELPRRTWPSLQERTTGWRLKYWLRVITPPRPMCSALASFCGSCWWIDCPIDHWTTSRWVQKIATRSLEMTFLTITMTRVNKNNGRA